MRTSEQINEIAAALAKAQGEMAPAVKDSTNPAFRSKYADLAANVEAARKPLAQNGLAVLQEATLRSTEDGAQRAVAVLTRIVHSSGQWIEFDPLSVPCAKPDAHGVDSATTYARRYALGAALGLVAEDDDGNAAVQQQPARESKPAGVKVPAGLDEAWKVLKAAASSGETKLKEAWSGLRPEIRAHIGLHHKAEWEVIKLAAGASSSEAA